MRLFSGLAVFAAGVAAQLNLTTIVSPIDPSIKITYKVPTGACTTAFPTQQQYTGWVSLPGSYPTNLFFWFVGARDQAQSTSLTIWLNGGPGSSSMVGFFNENGPCEVIVNGTNSYATVAREWGWDRASNMLFIDQPNQVGFSYDVLTNGSIDLLTNNIYTPPEPRPNSRPATAFLNGTFSSQNGNNTANTTETAAVAVWHMLQGLFTAFPELQPPERSPLGVNLFTESYGGKYGPAFASKWEQMNALRKSNTTGGAYMNSSATNSSASSSSIDINLVSLGILNGCVDDLVQAPYYPVMATSNTYGLAAVNNLRAQTANASFYAADGCRDQINQCRTAVLVRDANNTGSVADVNQICSNAYQFCSENVMMPYGDAGRSIYDISHLLPDSYPPSLYLEYLNTAGFKAAIGTTLNYTETSNTVLSTFLSTGDYEREALVPKLAALVNSGIRVGFLYGDRDYICNWMGGQAISLAVAYAAGGTYGTRFPSAGYAPIITNDSYIGGVVREFGNLSFSRIYQSGHFVPASQPETAFQVFARIIMGTSVSTGEVVNTTIYNTTGSANATSSMSLPSSPSQTCWLRNIPGSCSEDQKGVILGGSAVILDGALVSGTAASATSELPGTTVISTATTTQPLTGLFTATATPSTKSAASSSGLRSSWSWLFLVCTCIIIGADM